MRYWLRLLSLSLFVLGAAIAMVTIVPRHGVAGGGGPSQDSVTLDLNSQNWCIGGLSISGDNEIGPTCDAKLFWNTYQGGFVNKTAQIYGPIKLGCQSNGNYITLIASSGIVASTVLATSPSWSFGSGGQTYANTCGDGTNGNRPLYLDIQVQYGQNSGTGNNGWHLQVHYD